MQVQRIARRPMELSARERTRVRMIEILRGSYRQTGLREKSMTNPMGLLSELTEVLCPSCGLWMIERGPGPIALRTILAGR
jgi:hypothetical protein